MGRGADHKGQAAGIKAELPTATPASWTASPPLRFCGQAARRLAAAPAVGAAQSPPTWTNTPGPGGCRTWTPPRRWPDRRGAPSALAELDLGFRAFCARNRRIVIDGIFFRTRTGCFFRTRTGCPWRDLPREYGKWKAVYNRHRRWSLDGTWQEILARLQAGSDEAEGKDWTVSADSTVVRAHQHATGAGVPCQPSWSRGAAPNDKNPQAAGANPAKPGHGREALGRSRGGLSTKIYLAADRRCRPVTGILTPGQHGDCPQFIPLLARSASPAAARVGPAPDRAGPWPTRRTHLRPTPPTCASAGSRRSSR